MAEKQNNGLVELSCLIMDSLLFKVGNLMALNNTKINPVHKMGTQDPGRSQDYHGVVSDILGGSGAASIIFF